jgi:alkylhydroperoxidase family enzyme
MRDDSTFDDPRPPTEEEWGTPLVDSQSAPEIEQKFRRRLGMVSGVVPYVAPHPWLYRPFLFLSDPTLTALDEDFAAAISFIIARDNSCRFCYSTFRTLLRLSNYSPSDLQDLETHFAAQAFGEEAEWGLRLAVRLSRCTRIPEALDRLRALGHSDTAIREMAGISVLNLAANRIGTTLSIPVSTFEELADRWYLQPWRTLARPLLRLAPLNQNGWTALQSAESENMLSPWIHTLRGTPVGTVVQTLVHQWLDDDRPLSVRTKLLMLAMVARGLSATKLEDRLRSHLAAHHSISPDAFDAAVDYLGGEAVDANVEPLLRFARASIRYDFGPIKRVAYECTKDLERAGTLEAVASISLANAVARLETLFELEETSPPAG